jgi:branched-chain amino acid transport system permease protein
MTSLHPVLRIGLATVVVAVLAILPLFLARYGIYILSMWAVLTIAAIGLNLTLGYAGQISLAQGAFVGIGAYAAGILMTAHGWPMLAVLPVAMVLCFSVGWGLGYPALKVQHHYLAFVTLAFSTLAFLVFRNEEWLTHGVYGIEGIARPAFLADLPLPAGLSKPIRKALSYYYLCLAALLVVAGAVWWLARSPWGRAFMALRENPVRALSLGVDTRRYTLMAFAIGSALGGVSGVFYAPLVEFIEPGAFGLNLSLSILMMVIVGGSGYFLGPFVGALIAVLMPEWLRFTQGYYLILYAILVMVLLMFSPRGILGFFEGLIEERRTRKASAMRAAAKANISGEPIGGRS